MQRRLVAIMAADVVGYTLLMGRDEEGTLARLFECRQVIDRLVDQHHGRIFGSAGDSVIVEFASPVEAVRCAISIQTDLAHSFKSLPHDRIMTWRIGLNLGDAIVENDNLYGDGVNIAARLENLAEPGGILVSDDIFRHVEGKTGAEFETLGDQNLKNVAKPVHVHKVVLDTREWSKPDVNAQAGAPTDKPIVAVLPFKNLSKDPDQGYFCEGIGEDIITGLSKNPDILLISQNTTFAERERPLSVRDVKEQFGAQFVLEGSVRKAGRRTRVTAQLADAATDTQLWAERYERDIDDVFALQDEIVSSILHALGASDGVFEKTLRQRSRKSPPDSASAYDCFLQGRDLFYQHGDGGYDAAEALYEKAISLDSEFSRAYSALAWLHFSRFKTYQTRSFEEIRSVTHDLALHALRLDTKDFRAHWVLGGLYLHEGNFSQSVAEFDKAVRINPNDANLLAWSGEVLACCGREEEGLQRCEQAIRLNPNCPDWFYWHLAFTMSQLGRYEDALATLERMNAPDYAGRLKAAIYVYLGRLKEARHEADEFMKLVPTFSIMKWAESEHFADPAKLERYTDALRQAGLPE